MMKNKKKIQCTCSHNDTGHNNWGYKDRQYQVMLGLEDHCKELRLKNDKNKQTKQIKT
jgi:hypothetical protein